MNTAVVAYNGLKFILKILALFSLQKWISRKFSFLIEMKRLVSIHERVVSLL